MPSARLRAALGLGVVAGFVAGCAQLAGIADFGVTPDAGSDAAAEVGSGDATMDGASQGEAGADGTLADAPAASGDDVFAPDGGSATVDAPCEGAACPCPAGTSSCDGKACVSFSDDPRNCGGCGNDCGTRTCHNGQCMPVTWIGLPFSGPLLIDSTAIYGNAGGPLAVDLATGVKGAGGRVPISGLWTQSATSVYGPANSGNPLYIFDKASMVVAATLDAGSGAWQGASVSGSYLWTWSPPTAQNVSTLQAYTLDGGTVGAVAKPLTSYGCSAIAGDATGFVYAAAAYNPAQPTVVGPCVLYATTPTGSPSTPLDSPGYPAPAVMVLDQTTAYWLDIMSGMLYASARDGSKYRLLTKEPLTHMPVQLAVDSSNLYWTDGTAGTVSSIPISSMGAVPTVLASGQTGASGIAVNDTDIYWATPAGLMKYVK